jgi:hypothetical protein
MAGYLDQYGAGEERREKIVKLTILTVAVLAIAGAVLYFFLKNYPQERQAKAFFEDLSRQDYAAAYARWGCTAVKPCREYPMPEFMKDWGPQSGKTAGRVAKSRACGSGVILTVEYGDKPEDKLWVERGNLTIGFSPWPGCPAGQ